MKTHKLFAYGTLLEPEIQERLIGRTITWVPDILPKHRVTLARFDGALYPDIAGASDEVVRGKILEVTDDELTKFDEYEGENYVRYKVMLDSGVEAWIYDNVTV